MLVSGVDYIIAIISVTCIISLILLGLKSYLVASLQVHLQVHFENIEVHLARFAIQCH